MIPLTLYSVLSVLAESAAAVQPWRGMGVPGSGWGSPAAKGHVWLELDVVATLALWAVDHAFCQEDRAEALRPLNIVEEC